ncbi:MAG: hypothetical protein AAGI30_12000 [Planctomycetota bacterium]
MAIARIARLTCAALGALGVVVIATAAGGCNIVAPFYYIAEGPPKQPARFVLDTSRSLVIFVDDTRSVMPRRALQDIAGREADRTLLGEGKFPIDFMVASQAARRATREDRAGDYTSVVDIGRAVGAEVVVHVDVDQFGLASNEDSLTPQAAARVKVVDAVRNERIWPARESGHRVDAEIFSQPETVVISRDERFRLEESLAQELGVVVARLFYEHEPETLRSRRERVGFGN